MYTRPLESELNFWHVKTVVVESVCFMREYKSHSKYCLYTFNLLIYFTVVRFFLTTDLLAWFVVIGCIASGVLAAFFKRFKVFGLNNGMFICEHIRQWFGEILCTGLLLENSVNMLSLKQTIQCDIVHKLALCGDYTVAPMFVCYACFQQIIHSTVCYIDVL